jgi:hypothetical protein
MCLNKKNQRTLSSSLRAFLLQTATRMPESRSGHSSASPLLQQDQRPAVISPRWPYALCLRCSRVPLPQARRCELKIPCPRGSGGRSSATVFGRWLHLATCLSGETQLLSRARVYQIAHIARFIPHCSRQPMPRPFSSFGDVDLASKSYEIQPAMAPLIERGPAAHCGAKVTIGLEVYSGRERC